MAELTDKTRAAESIIHDASVLGLTYTMPSGEKADRLMGEIHRYEERYGPFDGRDNPQVARILNCDARN